MVADKSYITHMHVMGQLEPNRGCVCYFKVADSTAEYRVMLAYWQVIALIRGFAHRCFDSKFKHAIRCVREDVVFQKAAARRAAEEAYFEMAMRKEQIDNMRKDYHKDFLGKSVGFSNNREMWAAAKKGKR